MMRLSAALREYDGMVICARCDQPLGKLESLGELKRRLAVNRHRVTADPIGGDTDQFVDQVPKIAEYSCPGCGLLIDTEVTVQSSPVSGQRR